ncbi:MAG: T9SS type A sorting domain-containing protein [Tannerella sp.]|nr:T9SS type A sorting domain-containing protein [Tannerella sp.]
MRIYNSSGTLVRQLRAAGRTTTIDVSALANGMYLVRVNNSGTKILKTK